MAGRKQNKRQSKQQNKQQSRQKKQKRPVWHMFLLALVLTLSVGGVVLAGGWALKEPDAGDLHTVIVVADTAVRETADERTAADEGNTAGKLKENVVQGDHPEGVVAEGKYTELLADEELCRQQKIYAKDTAEPEEISIVFAGDILFDDQYAIMAKLKQRGGAIESSISSELLDIMRGADIFMVNNEFPYTDRGEPIPEKTFTFRARPEYVSYLSDMGVDIVSLANNHARDYGEISLTDTIDILNQAGIPFVGAGYDLQEAVQPVYFIANDTKIAFISATQIERMENPSTKGATETAPGVFRCLDVSRLLEVVKNAKQVSDYVIVYIHWGTESTDETDWAQKEQAPQIAEAGADLIIGDHPHVLQPLGYCGDTPVVYSLGNFLFNSKAQDTCLIRAVINSGGLKSLQFIPGKQENCSVSMLHGAERERVLSYIKGISPEVAIDAEGYVTKR